MPRVISARHTETYQHCTTDNALSQARAAADLPAMILERFPDADRHRDCYRHVTKAQFVAVWRGEKSPSVSLAVKGGAWVWHDFGTHDGGNAYHFLTRVCDLTPAQAAQELLERAGLTNTARSNPRFVESELDRQKREFQREHSKADPGFFEDWLEYRADGGREIGTPVSRYAMKFVATAPSLPDFPGELIAHTRLGQSVPLERPPFGPANLETLAFWIADALAPTLAPPKNTTSKNTVQHASQLAPHQTSLGVGAMVQEFDPLAKFHRKLERVTRGAH